MDLAKKVALVTGSATGTGRSIVLALAARGCRTVVNYTRSAAEAEETAREVAELGGEALLARADVSVNADCLRLIDETMARFGRLDILVNNAGTTVFIPFKELDALTEEAWDKIFAVNVKGAFFMARAAAPHLRADGG